MDIAIIDDDIQITDGVPEIDEGLETAIQLSLFTDRRDENSEEKRGWWADALEEVPLGSRLWTLAREKNSSDVRALAKQYCEEALQWIIDDGVSETFSVDISRNGLYAVDIAINVPRPDGNSAGFKYFYSWEAQATDPVHAR